MNGDYDRAIADLNEAIRLDPRRTLAYSERGHAYAAKGDHAKAREDYDKAGVPQLALLPDPVLPANKAPAPAAKPPMAAPAPAPVASLERPAPAAPAVAQLGRRVALVIGNSATGSGRCRTPATMPPLWQRRWRSG